MSMPSVALAETSFADLLLVTGAEQRRITVRHTPFTIGRKPDRDLPLTDGFISREHAVIVFENGGYYIVDQGSRGGVFVNGTRCERHRLQPNDRLEFGADGIYLVFQPRTPAAAAPEPLSQISLVPRSGASSELQQLRLFLEAAHRLNTTGVLDEVLVTLLDCALRLTHAERGFVFLREEGALRLAAGRNARGDLLLDDSGISRSLLQQAADADSEFMIGDTSTQADLAGRASILANHLRTVIAIPLRRAQADAGASVLGVLYLDSRFTSKELPSVSHDILRAIAVDAAGVLEKAHLVEMERVASRARQELSIAAAIQQRLMSVRIPDIPFAEVQGRNFPCHEVGGDFFDVVRTSDAVSLVITDVSGKGVSAALLGSVLQGMMYSQLAHGVALEDAVTAAHQFLCDKAVGDKYATMLLARLWANGELELLNCGHVPPRLVSAGAVVEPDNINPPVGLLIDVSFRGTRLQLHPGDRLLAVTDGVVEAENTAGEFFGCERLDQAVRSGCEGVLRSVREFCGDCPQQDDCTVVELLYRGS